MAPLGDGEPVETCPACHAPYHGSCWSENRGCAIYGCRMVPATEGLKPLEIPPAFWGREDKECPKCGKTIMALAVRCRHCGTMVEARPEDKASFERRQVRAASAPALRKWSVALLIGSLAPGIALISAIAAMSTLKRRRADLAKLPATYGGLLRIAIAVGFTQSAILLLGWTAYWIKATLEL
jgi:hypothetical protein